MSLLWWSFLWLGLLIWLYLVSDIKWHSFMSLVETQKRVILTLRLSACYWIRVWLHTFSLGSLLLKFFHGRVVILQRNKEQVLSVVECFEHTVRSRHHILTEETLQTIKHDTAVTVVKLQTICDYLHDEFFWQHRWEEPFVSSDASGDTKTASDGGGERRRTCGYLGNMTVSQYTDSTTIKYK